MLICIGGVCVPATAVIPIAILCFKWVASKLAQMGLLPKALQDLLQVQGGPPKEGEKSVGSERKQAAAAPPGGPSLVKALETDDEFSTLVKESDKVICKFTATWCKPCHKIQPFFEQSSSQYHNKKYSFRTIDVDDFDEIATTYNVAMMPTFVVVEKGGNVLGKYAGSDEHQLQRFLQEHLD